MTDKEKLKSYYKYKPPLRFIKNKFFGTEHENLYEDKIQILYLQYALQLLWIVEVVWIEDLRLSRSRVQDLIIDELTVQDLIKVVQQYKLTYKNPCEQALVILVVLINRLWFPDRVENKYDVMRIKNASSISFAGKHYQAYCNKKLKDNFDTYAQGNFFPLPKAVFNFDLCAEEIALYAYLMHMQLLRSRRNDIAKEMHIAPSHLRWYAAYHNKDKNPHVHMLVWSDRPREAYLDKTGIHNIKKTMAGDIFRQENYCVYKKQTEHRDHIRQSFRERMKEIVAEINDAAFNDPVLEEMLTKLAARMKAVKGKKQYGYLDRHTKAKVDAIVKRIAEDEKIQELYELWYQCQCEIYRTYTDIIPPKEPIEKNDVFKSLRNSVVKFALDITAIPDMADYDGHYSYEPNAFQKTDVQKAKELLEEGKYDEAWTLLLDASHKGNSYAQAFIGDCLCRGRYWKRNKDMGMTYLGFAAEKNNSYALFRLGIEYLESDPEEAEYWFKEAAELNNSFAKYSLYRLYKNGIMKPELSSDTYAYLRQAAEAGMDAAEYEYSKYLKDKNPELSREYMKRSAERGFYAAMYAYGKTLLDEGCGQEALTWLESAAERDTWARTQLGLLYLYRFNNFEKFKEHIESAANDGDSYAKAAIKHYNSNRNYQIVMGIANLFYYASRIFEDDAAEHDEQIKLGEIDSKLKREIRQKREAQGLHW